MELGTATHNHQVTKCNKAQSLRFSPVNGITDFHTIKSAMNIPNYYLQTVLSGLRGLLDKRYRFSTQRLRRYLYTTAMRNARMKMIQNLFYEIILF